MATFLTLQAAALARPSSAVIIPLHSFINIRRRLMSTNHPLSNSYLRTRSSISALVTHIQDAAKVLEEHYSTYPSSSGVPSLDLAEEHSLDQHIMSREVRTAVQTIEGACAQLVDTVGNPSHILMNRFMEYYYPLCIHIALLYRIPDIINEKPDGMHVSEVGEKTGIHQRKIGRILRMLTARHIFKEVSENVFANNRLSFQLLSSNPLADVGLHFADEALRSSVLLPQILTDKDWGHSFKQNETAFNEANDCTGTIWDHYEYDHPVGTHRGKRFSRGLRAWAAALESLSSVHGYPWKDLGNNASVCDVGCGIGTVSIALAKAHPNLQFVLQDLPRRLEQAQNEVWPEKCPDALANNRAQFVPLNFVTDVPVSGCDVYYLKNIIHDWSDEIAVQILTNVRRALAPHSKVLLQNHILQHAYRKPEEESDTEQAPHPMLANYGAGRIRHYAIDVHFMTMLNSEVRTLPHFIGLGESAGLKFMKNWDLGETSLLEYKLP